MDEGGIERRGLAPLQPELARIAAIASPATLARALAQLSRTGCRPCRAAAGAMPAAPAATLVASISRNPTRYLPALTQGGIGLPDRDYYLIDNPASPRPVRPTGPIWRPCSGWPDWTMPEARAARVYALEERSPSPIGRERSSATWTSATICCRAPNSRQKRRGWTGTPSSRRRIWPASDRSCPRTSAIAGLAAAARERAPGRLARLSGLSRDPRLRTAGAARLRRGKFRLRGQDPGRHAGDAGRAGSAPRQIMDRAMGHAVGRIYLASYFPPAVRAQAEVMTREIKPAMARASGACLDDRRDQGARPGQAARRCGWRSAASSRCAATDAGDVRARRPFRQSAARRPRRL